MPSLINNAHYYTEESGDYLCAFYQVLKVRKVLRKLLGKVGRIGELHVFKVKAWAKAQALEDLFIRDRTMRAVQHVGPGSDDSQCCL